MRRLLPLLFLAATGCSNAPVAGFLDCCFPCRTKGAANPDPAVDVRPQPPVDPLRPGPAPGPNPAPPIPPPADLGP